MTPLQFAVPVGALESVAGELPYVILVLLLASFVTRHLRHSHHERAAAQDADTLSRYAPHVVVSALLVLSCFLFMVVDPHTGMVISVLVTGTTVTDFFEFEARMVELRNNLEIERPKAAIAASFLTLLYALYISLFWVIQDQWAAVI